VIGKYQSDDREDGRDDQKRIGNNAADGARVSIESRRARGLIVQGQLLVGRVDHC